VSNREKPKILIVDDEEFLLRACKRLLQDEFDVHTVSSGKAALELLTERIDFSAILIDICIPDISGKKLFEFIRAGYPGIEKKVIFITGGALNTEAQGFIDEHCQNVLQKPFDSKSLLEKINNLTCPK
jgi:CheY-like chemotaxis protein